MNDLITLPTTDKIEAIRKACDVWRELGFDAEKAEALVAQLEVMIRVAWGDDGPEPATDDAPAEVEPIGPCDLEEQDRALMLASDDSAEHHDLDEPTPAEALEDTTDYDAWPTWTQSERWEPVEHEAASAAWFDRLEALGYADGRLTDADVIVATGAAG